jgi:hypothetical protein
MAQRRAELYACGMETPAEVRERWRYLRDLLIDQLERFETGVLQLHAHDLNISAGAISMLKKNIRDFDEMIARSDARQAQEESDRPDPEI